MKRFGLFKPLERVISGTSLSNLYLKVSDISQLAALPEQQVAIITQDTGSWKQGDRIIKISGRWVKFETTLKLLSAPTQLRGYKKGNIAELKWRDPQDTVDVQGSILVKWVKTILVRKVGSAPQNIQDGKQIFINTDANKYNDPNGPVVYDPVPEADGDLTWFYRAFAIGNNGYVSASDPMQLTNMSWKDILTAVKAGRAKEIFAPGDVISYADKDHPEGVDLVVASIESHQSPSRAAHPHLVTFVFKYPYDQMPFDAIKNIKDETTGTYYVLTRDQYYQRAKINKYYNIDSSGRPVKITTTPGLLIPEVPPVYELISTDRGKKGINFWQDCDIRAWLNLLNMTALPRTLQWYRDWMNDNLTITDPDGTVHPGYERVLTPMTYIQRLDSELAEIITQTSIHTVTSVADGAPALVTTNDLFFIPSITELTGEKVHNLAEGQQFDLYKTDDPINPIYIQGTGRLVLQKNGWWTRSVPQDGLMDNGCEVSVIDEKIGINDAKDPVGVVIAFSIG